LFSYTFGLSQTCCEVSYPPDIQGNTGAAGKRRTEQIGEGRERGSLRGY